MQKRTMQTRSMQKRSHQKLFIVALLWGVFLWGAFQQAYAINTISIQQLVLDKIAARLDTMRVASRHANTGYLAGDLGGSCLSYGPFFYGNGIRQSRVNNFSGYNSNTVGVGWVGDNMFNLACGGSLRAGAGLAGAYTVTTPRGELDFINTDIRAATIQPLLYASIEFDRSFVDGILILNYSRFRANRTTSNLGSSSASFKGFQWGGKLRTGYVMTLTSLSQCPLGTLELTPLAGIQYVWVTHTQFKETGAMNFEVSGRHFSYYQFSFGGRIAAVNEPRGFYTELHALMLVDYQRNPIAFTMTSSAPFGPTFILPGISPSKVGANVGASVTMNFQEHVLFTTGLDFDVRTRFLGYAGWIRLRWLF